MPNYKKNFTLNSSLKIEKEKKLLANIGLIIKKIRIQRGITRDILAIKSKISLRYLAKLESGNGNPTICLLYTSPSPRDLSTSRMPSSA